ncbi:carboxyl-terminal protease [Robertkochia marina]|uniref:Carboxyl-terminal protease n=1 Tax=Robertkochia marina TaxID=1227945 RepID=A0A4S3LZD9_9FLAO|nr:S41 family peptidase [Robertkochia marina]THD67472.1 carboxyl-terminal protease [Robertkochia marina]TRZ44659.1 carboxyl-terminal protease [Robertkochia marina]
MEHWLRNFTLLGLIILISGCSSDDGVNTKEPPTDNGVELESEANLFTWNALNLWYYWQGDVAELNDNFDDNRDEFHTYLNRFADPADLFENSLRFSGDRFSAYNEDYRDLTDGQQGISTNHGLEFGLARFANSNDVFGYVRYIIPNSSAAQNDISRGELFTHVNGVQMNINNFESLLFENDNTYILGMADITGPGGAAPDILRENVALNGKEVTLTKDDGLREDPIFITRVIESGGITIGYLMYNSFTRAFDDELNNVFADFRAQGVTELILDLRYNPGGSVNTARYLASMIYGTNTEQLFIRQRWNDKVNSLYSDSFFEDYFAETVSTADGDFPLNSLELNRVFVLTTLSTASASELIINGLDPYMDVIQIGATTTGKNEFSIVLVDNPDNSYLYSPDTENGINPDVSWGLQPTTGISENSAGFSDYATGLEPEIEQFEDVTNLGVLGELDEPLLARALQEITGVSAKAALEKGQQIYMEVISNSKMGHPLKDRMYIDGEKLRLN